MIKGKEREQLVAQVRAVREVLRQPDLCPEVGTVDCEKCIDCDLVLHLDDWLEEEEG